MYGNLIHHVPVLAQHRERFLITLLEHIHDFCVNLCRCIICTVQRTSALQILTLHSLKPHQTKLFAHAVARDHRACNACRFLDIIGRTCRHGVKHNLLRCAPAQKTDDHIMQLILRIEIFFILRHMHHIAERPHRARYDRNLLYRLRVFLQRTDQRVTDFMVGDNLALLLAHNAVLLLLADKHHLHCVEQIFLADELPAFFDSVDRRLIDHIGKVRADCAARRKRDRVKIYSLIHQHILGVDFKNIDTSLQIRLIHNNAPVKASRSQKRFVKNLRSVRRRKNNNSLLAVKTVHL